MKSLVPPVLGLLMGMNNMNDMKKMTDYETPLERRLEKACERNGWIASAHVAFGGDYVNCQLEKFGRRMKGQSLLIQEHLGLEHLGLDLWKCVIFRRLVCFFVVYLLKIR